MRPVCQFIIFLHLCYFATKFNQNKKKETKNLIEQSFQREGSSFLACNERNAFFLLNKKIDTNFGHVNMCIAITNL